MEVYKSNKTLEEFSEEKLKNGIREAYETVGEKYHEEVVNSVISNLYVYDKISSKEIRRQVEESLMSINKKVARVYMDKYHDITELTKKNTFIKDYINASNASTGSKYDSNANVSNKNIVTMGQELYKINNIKQNRYIMQNKIKSLYGKKLSEKYIEDLIEHIIYKHDETALPGYPYCVAITMYPFLVDGLCKLGGVSKPPTNLKSFCGEFVNMVFSISSQFAGAVATPEYLMYMDYFIRHDYGENYIDKLNDIVENTQKGSTLDKVIENCFQQVVHSINMPTGSRGYQAVFWNISYFDESYFKGVFGDFTFPDGSKPVWETLSWLQKKFMKWFNQERTKYELTFPVETMALLTDDEDVLDKEYADFTCEMLTEGHSFFIYLSDSPDSLASCCRLRNSLKDMNDDSHNHTTHQFSMGTASVATGSKSVMTINLNRVVQLAVKRYCEENPSSDSFEMGKQYFVNDENKAKLYSYISQDINDVTTRIHKYQRAFNEIEKDFFEAKMLPVYDAGFINMKKQYLTVGVNGLTDAAEFLGFEIKPSERYQEFVNVILETINKSNAKDRTKETMFNTEFVPGENLSVKNYNWDKMDNYYVSPKHIMYSSYFFNPEDESLSVIDKIKLHGKDYVKYLDGGSANHMNLKEHLSFNQYRKLLKIAAKEGCNYWTVNVKNTICNDCGYISKHTLSVCPHCGSKNLDYLTRIIGYMKRVSSFSEPRQNEEHMRAYIHD